MNSTLVLLSGGQDSATCLALATRSYDKVYSVSFDYGQRHSRELICSKKLAWMAGVVEHFVIPVSSLKTLGDSALIGFSEDISSEHKRNENLPASFVPGRNLIFLSLASAKAYQLEIHHLMIGTCQTDFSGYPDCRDASMKAVQVAAFLCLDYPIYIHTPLMWLDKKETVELASFLPGCMDALAYSHTCYEGAVPPCGVCSACKLRAKGFEEVGIEDPLIVRTRGEN